MLGEERQQAILAAVEQRHSVSVQELMQLNDVGLQITRYYHTSLGAERDRILLKRESGRLAKAVIEYLGCKCNQVCVAVACLNIAEYLLSLIHI